VPVVALDARLLHAGPAALDAAVADHLGTALLLRFDGITRPVPVDTAAWLQHVPAVTVAVGPVEDAAVFDLVTADEDAAQAWGAAFEQSPQALHAAALLVRHPVPDAWAGLVAESATYSMLQAGPAFRSWRASHATAPAGDAGPRVRVARRGRATEIVLTRPARHNALDVRMRDELFDALHQVPGDTTPVIVRAEGPSFSSGGDLDEFGTFPDPASAHAVRLGRSLASRFHELAPRLVVGIHGACLGAGIELPAFAGTVVAAADTRCGLPEPAIGLIPGAGGTVSIPARIGRSRFLELLLLSGAGALLDGETVPGTIPASTALAWGLVDEVVPNGDLESRLLELAESLP
jgi:enoyl-CoA hydratase/carnithine racemase